MILHHVNPESVQFDTDEIHRITRVRMARWLGHGDPAKWDAMPYLDQCDCLEIARAEQEIEKYEIAQRRR